MQELVADCLSMPMPSAAIWSHSSAFSLMKMIFTAKKALAAYLISGDVRRLRFTSPRLNLKSFDGKKYFAMRAFHEQRLSSSDFRQFA
jgi:hypothetical protein